jgi:ADP-ribosyl-[dinitrogen reductase] hydrolase
MSGPFRTPSQFKPFKAITIMKSQDLLLGIAVADALGVPVEFNSRESLTARPVTGMREFGSHHQPAGTWSDDSSLAFCLAESLCNGYDLADQAKRFVAWRNEAYWSARGRVFDIGIATNAAIMELARGRNPTLAGGREEGDNGNGSLMRILPLIAYLKDLPIAERFEKVREVSSLTHGHIRSVIACFLYTEFALRLLAGYLPGAAILHLRTEVLAFMTGHPLCPGSEIEKFHRVLFLQVGRYDQIAIEDEAAELVHSSGYVVSTLEASLWCLFQTESYADAVLTAVNLGKDTDTTAAVTGGLAGLFYGAKSIPAEWLDVLARRDDIIELAGRLDKRYF